jgi:hypothetical protein
MTKSKNCCDCKHGISLYTEAGVYEQLRCKKLGCHVRVRQYCKLFERAKP